jgi:5-methylcytosine-specific restriction endonuclease McrA
MTTRVSIPTAVKREIMIEASYRCAVPRCMSALAIDVHHIDGDPANNDPSNLIALCPTCHSAFHRKTFVRGDPILETDVAAVKRCLRPQHH